MDIAKAWHELSPNSSYIYSVSGTNSGWAYEGSAYGANKIFKTVPASPPSIESESVSHITETDATLEAQINPDGLETTYEFFLAEPEPRCLEAHPPCMIAQRAPRQLPGGTLPASYTSHGVSLDLNGAGVSLIPGGEYKYWVVATNAAGTTQLPSQRFTALGGPPPPEGSAPTIESESASHITPTDATLEAQIDTEGLETTYRFFLQQISPCPNQGPPCVIQYLPAALPSGKLLGSFVGQSVSVDLKSAGVTLKPGAEYRYLVAATNSAGTTEGHLIDFSTPSETPSNAQTSGTGGQLSAIQSPPSDKEPGVARRPRTSSTSLSHHKKHRGRRHRREAHRARRGRWAPKL